MKPKSLSFIVILFSSLTVLAQLTAGQIDDFEDGTIQGWFEGAFSPNPPINITTDGPSGVNDNYLQDDSAGGTGSGSKMVIRNMTQWSGNYTSEGILAIRFNARVLTADLDIRIAMTGGGGVGLATRKLILDIGFNLKNKRNEQTDRFDLRAGFFLKKNFIDFYIQVYEGFNIKNSINDTKIFRKDIKSIAVGIDYLYLINRGGFSTSLLRSGLESQKQNIYSFGLGGFVFFNQISGDTSIVPQEYYSYFNKQARIIDFTDYGFGIMGGLVSVLKLPSNFYLGLSVKIGAGLNV